MNFRTFPHLSAPVPHLHRTRETALQPHRRTTSYRGAGVRCGSVWPRMAGFPHPHLFRTCKGSSQ